MPEAITQPQEAGQSSIRVGVIGVLYRGYVGIMEKKMETTIQGLDGEVVQAVEFRQ